MYTFDNLKTLHRQHREHFPVDLNLRVHRALSWLKRAEAEENDPDAQFIFLWIAFNAAYANEYAQRRTFSEQRQFLEFIDKLLKLDSQKQLQLLVWQQYSGPIQILLKNPYVFEKFWSFQNGMISEDEWQEALDQANQAANRALAKTDTKKVLAIVFSRLYVLRNQVLHGGATWQSSVNREQLRDAVKILRDTIPVVIHIMLNNPDQVWGEAAYPVIN